MSGPVSLQDAPKNAKQGDGLCLGLQQLRAPEAKTGSTLPGYVIRFRSHKALALVDALRKLLRDAEDFSTGVQPNRVQSQ